MPVLAGSLLHHHLERRAGKITLAGFADRKTEHRFQQFRCAERFVLVFGIDPDVRELETEHCADGAAGQFGDLVPFLVADQVVLHHETAAAADDLIELQVGEQVVGVDPAGRHEAHRAVGGGHGFQHFESADRLRRKELDGIQPELDRLLDIRGIGGAGDDRDILRLAVGDGLGIQPRADDHLRARGNGGVDLRCVQHRAGEHQHIGESLGDLLDRLGGAGGTERDLRRGKSAVDQRLGKRDRVVGIADLDDGDHAQFIHFSFDFGHGILFSFGMVEMQSQTFSPHSGAKRRACRSVSSSCSSITKIATAIRA